MSPAGEPNPLPRRLAPHLWWLGECLNIPYQGTEHHIYSSVYLIRGDDGALLVEAGLPGHMEVVRGQLGELLEDPRELKYVWATHQETPHAGGAAELLSEYPEAKLVGDTRDYHLFFPEFVDRLQPIALGESIDLGGTQFTAVEPVIKDLITSQWGYDSRSGALFTADGFAYSHFHEKEHCGKVAEETPELPIADLAALLGELALYWWQFHDLDPHIARIQEMIDELDIKMILPSHGLPITDCQVSVPIVFEGFRMGSGRAGTDVFG